MGDGGRAPLLYKARRCEHCQCLWVEGLRDRFQGIWELWAGQREASDQPRSVCSSLCSDRKSLYAQDCGLWCSSHTLAVTLPIHTQAAPVHPSTHSWRPGLAWGGVPRAEPHRGPRSPWDLRSHPVKGSRGWGPGCTYPRGLSVHFRTSGRWAGAGSGLKSQPADESS